MADERPDPGLREALADLVRQTVSVALRPYIIDNRPAAEAWMTKRVARGIADDLEDLERDGHITGKEPPF